MASNITRWPWRLDASTFAAEFPTGVVTAQQMAPGTVQWTSDGAVAGDKVVLQHADGKPLWTSPAATGADFSADYKFPDSVRAEGLKVATFNSGFLDWYFR